MRLSHSAIMTWGDMDAVIELEIGAGQAPGTYAVRVRNALAGGTPSAP